MKIQSAEFLLSAARQADCPPGDRPEVAFLGRSNVGKSSLINSLLNRRRLAMTSRTPGKTRTINFFRGERGLLLRRPAGLRLRQGLPQSPCRLAEDDRDLPLGTGQPLQGAVLLVDLRHPPTKARPPDEGVARPLRAPHRGGGHESRQGRLLQDPAPPQKGP